MRPAPPRGAVFEQLPLRCAEFQDEFEPEVSRLAPKPSECPTCVCRTAESDVQSAQVNPGSSVPSAADPVMMSCSTGGGDPIHWPLMGFPFSSTKSVELPFIAWSSVTLFATRTSLELIHGPLPIRSRALVARPPFDASRS